ncbi:hypothetical protein [Sphingomonas fennica]|uniref:Uncharacterized protein n=1 Tax=Edaphosphingomonas fennica TaxID=114404 RepID=A0A2T4HT48_9SPHN|nr:hypothetical protein [Sphingomonas fennica]PTD18984.1 hypothetical protein CV103_14105 [Sphingomonas fennica]
MALILAALALLQSIDATPDPASLAGAYNGSRAEVAAELILRPDGRFEYGLAYGALDETASGRWHVAAGSVVLDSDPVRAPAFSFTDRGRGEPGVVTARLVLPKELNPQFFSFVLVGPMMSPVEGRVRQDGTAEIAYDPAQPPRAIHLILPIYDLVSQEFPLDLKGGGRQIEVRFAPNDLGRAAFNGTRLPIDGDKLHFERFGEAITFRRR